MSGWAAPAGSAPGRPHQNRRRAALRTRTPTNASSSTSNLLPCTFLVEPGLPLEQCPECLAFSGAGGTPPPEWRRKRHGDKRALSPRAIFAQVDTHFAVIARLDRAIQ